MPLSRYTTRENFYGVKRTTVVNQSTMIRGVTYHAQQNYYEISFIDAFLIINLFIFEGMELISKVCLPPPSMPSGIQVKV